MKRAVEYRTCSACGKAKLLNMLNFAHMGSPELRHLWHPDCRLCRANAQRRSASVCRNRIKLCERCGTLPHRVRERKFCRICGTARGTDAPVELSSRRHWEWTV